MKRITTATAAFLTSCLIFSTGCRDTAGPSGGSTLGREIVAKLAGVWQLSGELDRASFTKYVSTPVWLEFKPDGSWSTRSDEPSARYSSLSGKWRYERGRWEFGSSANSGFMLLVSHDSNPNAEEEWHVNAYPKTGIGVTGAPFKGEAIWHAVP